jgi:hypothetical protein
MPRPEPDLPAPGPWFASVVKTGRWSYRVVFRHGDRPPPYRSRRIWGSLRFVDDVVRKALNRLNQREAQPEQPETWTVGKETDHA